MTYRFKPGDRVITKGGDKVTLMGKAEDSEFPGYTVLEYLKGGILYDKSIDRLADQPKLRFGVGDRVRWRNGIINGEWVVDRISDICGEPEYTIKTVELDGSVVKGYAYGHEIEPFEEKKETVTAKQKVEADFRREQLALLMPDVHVPYPPWNLQAMIYREQKPKKKGFKQMAQQITKTFRGWLSPDKQAVMDAFTRDGELILTPELQQYLLEKWMEDKDFIALAKRINKENSEKK